MTYRSIYVYRFARRYRIRSSNNIIQYSLDVLWGKYMKHMNLKLQYPCVGLLDTSAAYVFSIK